MTQLPPPGWYPDNADPALVRWWDGAQWTPFTDVKAHPATTVQRQRQRQRQERDRALAEQVRRDAAARHAAEQQQRAAAAEAKRVSALEARRDEQAAAAERKAVAVQQRAEATVAKREAAAVSAAAAAATKAAKHEAKEAAKVHALGVKQQKQHVRQITRANRGFDKRHAAWEAEVRQLQRWADQARDLEPAPLGDIILKPGEGIWDAMGCQLIEQRAGARTYVGGSSGVSIPVGSIGGHSVRYNVGRTKGHIEQGPPEDKVIDVGKAVITTTRIVFVGGNQTRECLLAKLVAVERTSSRDVSISVSNRTKPTRLQFGTDSDGSTFRFLSELAIADANGSRSQFAAAAQRAYDAALAREPLRAE